jgi:Protein of unknown function (DUF2934)
VNTPYRPCPGPVYILFMEQNNLPKNQKAAVALQPVVNQSEANFTPSPDEVARRAYFSYVNQGSMPGHAVQHWLEAEAQLLAERKLTRTHRFHNWDLK